MGMTSAISTKNRSFWSNLTAAFPSRRCYLLKDTSFCTHNSLQPFLVFWAFTFSRLLFLFKVKGQGNCFTSTDSVCCQYKYVQSLGLEPSRHVCGGMDLWQSFACTCHTANAWSVLSILRCCYSPANSAHLSGGMRITNKLHKVLLFEFIILTDSPFVGAFLVLFPLCLVSSVWVLCKGSAGSLCQACVEPMYFSAFAGANPQGAELAN